MTPADQETNGLAARAASAFHALRDGDPSMMSRLVDEVTPLLWHIARHQGLDQASAEDVVQTSWMRLLEHADRITDHQSVLKWLITTTRREAWRVSRLGRRDDPLEDSTGSAAGTDDSEPGPEDAVIQANTQAVVWRHFRQLPERCQQLLRVIAFADRPDYASMAQALGMPIGSIGPTRGRCLAKLRALLLNDPAWEALA